MGKKSKIVPQRVPTKRQLSRWQREARIQRLVIVGGAIAIFIILAIPLVGFAQEYLLKGRETVARVNESSLSLTDFSKILGLRQYLLDNQRDNLERAFSQSGSDPNSQLQASLQRLESSRASLPGQIVQDWISGQLLQEEADRLGIAVTPDEITSAIRSEFEPLPATGEERQPLSDEEFQRSYQDFLSRARTTDSLYRELRSVPMLAQRIEERLGADVKSPGPQVHIQGIIVPTQSAANDVVTRLENGEDFATVAQETSTDQETKDSGGDLGWAPHGLLEKELEDAVFSAQVGKVGGPIEAGAGYVVYRVVDRDDNREIEPDALAQIKSNLLDRWLQEAETTNKVERYLTSDKSAWAEKQVKRK